MGNRWEEPTVRCGDPTVTNRVEGMPSPGQQWGKFLIEKRLGGGGQAEVFQAFDQRGTAGHVALKVISERASYARVQEWADAEAQALLRLEHPNIVRVRDAGRIGPFAYVASELLDGLPLSAYVRQSPPTTARTRDWMVQLADALHYAHGRGIVHRDIKPENVVVTGSGKPLLIDFGLASLLSPYGPGPPAVSGGTPAFIAPEQAREEDEVDHRVDVFALGAILKFILTGRGPYEGATDVRAALRQARAGDVERVSEAEVSGECRGLCRIANRALEPDPDKRYRNAHEMAEALRRVHGRPVARAAAIVGAAIVAAALLALLVSRLASSVPATIDASLEVLFLPRDGMGIPQALTADVLPLQTGDLIRIRADLSEPWPAYLIAAGPDGKPRLLYPEQGADARPVGEIVVPADRKEWLPLTGPSGTEILVLLVRREPLADLDTFMAEVGALVPAIAPSPAGLVLAGEKGTRFVPAEKPRGLGDEPVRREEGAVASLVEHAREQGSVVRLIAFPHGADGSSSE